MEIHYCCNCSWGSINLPGQSGGRLFGRGVGRTYFSHFLLCCTPNKNGQSAKQTQAWVLFFFSLEALWSTFSLAVLNFDGAKISLAAWHKSLQLIHHSSAVPCWCWCWCWWSGSSSRWPLQVLQLQWTTFLRVFLENVSYVSLASVPLVILNAEGAQAGHFHS